MAQSTRPAAYIAHIKRLFEYFRSVVQADEYSFEVEYVETLDPESAEPSIAAEIHIDTTYLNFSVAVSDGVLWLWKSKQWREIATTVCHECCHLLTEPLYNEVASAYSRMGAGYLEDVRERQTQRICNTIMSLVPEEDWMPLQRSKRAA